MKIFSNLNNKIKSIKKFIAANKFEVFILFLILAVGAFLRLYKIDQYMTFLGDEGRDVIIVRRIFTEAHPPLIGPGTSIGNMYLGPMYYYFMAPALLLAAFSPVGPAIEIALLGVATIWFVWYVGRLWFGKTVGIVSSLLYAISPTVIIYSRSSWNPNIMPFFSLLAVYSIWIVWREKKFNWLIVLGFSFAAAMQSHYLALLLAPTLGIFWFLTYLNSKKERKLFIKKSLLGFGLFLLLMSPLVMFDARHGWINTKAMYTFFTVRQTTVSIRPWTAIPKIPESLKTINTSLIGGRDEKVGAFATSIVVLSLFILIAYLLKMRKIGISKVNPAYFLLVVWMGVALIGFGLYKQNIYDHYYGFVFPVPYLLIGIIVSMLFNYKLIGKLFGLALVIYLVNANLSKSPLKDTPNNQMGRAYNVAQKVKLESGGRPFNLGVIAERNYEDGYKYFLLKDGQPVVNIDSQVKDSIKDQLFAVCELPHDKCDPTHNATASIANFGWSTVENNWEVDGVIIYKLVHTEKK